ncbi:hypothetical protein Tco_1422917 [Tanacetum coccineum]
MDAFALTGAWHGKVLPKQGIVVNVVNMERGFLSSKGKRVKQKKGGNTAKPAINKENNHTDPNDEGFHADPNELTAIDSGKLDDDGAELIKRMNTVKKVTVNDSPTNLNKSGPSFIGPTSYAKLVTG